jgi:hypothetical protein
MMKTERKRQLVKARSRWECNIVLDPGEIILKCVDWFTLNQDTDKWPTVLNMDLKIRIP